MKKYLISGLVVAMALGATLAALAQQDDAQRQRRQQSREAQQKAIEVIQADVAKLKAGMDEAAKSMGDRTQFQNLSEEERTKLREQFAKRREAQQQILADIELQVARLKGQRQLRTEHQKAMEELTGIRDLAAEEKASKTAERLTKLIDQKQAKYDEMLKKLGFEQQQ